MFNQLWSKIMKKRQMLRQRESNQSHAEDSGQSPPTESRLFQPEELPQSQSEESGQSQSSKLRGNQLEQLHQSQSEESNLNSRNSRRGLTSDVVRSAQAFYLYNLEDKIVDLTGPIQQRAKVIRDKPPVNWQPYLKTEMIDENDYDFLTAFQKTKESDQRKKLLNEYEIDAYKTLLKVPECILHTEEMQKILVLIDDLLWEDLSRIHHFKEAADHPWKPFFNLLSHKDEFVKNSASRIITKLLDTNAYTPPSSDTNFFINWLKNEMRADNEYLLCVARCLQKLLRYDAFKLVFYRLNGILRIIKLLMSEIKQQAQYQFTFCIWLLSMNPELAKRLTDYDIIEVFVDLLMDCPIEINKLPRVILATFRNLLEKPIEPEVKKRNALAMIQCKLLRVLNTARERSKEFKDPELLEDFEVVGEIIKMYVAELSTFDEYALEVRSGSLEWSVVHTSKPFWVANAQRLNENDYELLQMLISLLYTSKDSRVLCVAAHDLGAYMSHYLRGKTLVEQFGGKDGLLKIINDEDPEVKYHALKSLQILMLNNYDLLIDFAGDVKLADLLKKEKSKK